MGLSVGPSPPLDWRLGECDFWTPSAPELRFGEWDWGRGDLCVRVRVRVCGLWSLCFASVLVRLLVHADLPGYRLLTTDL